MSVQAAVASKTTPFAQLDVDWEKEQGAVWCHLAPEPRPCFNPQILSELIRLDQWMASVGLDRERLQQRPHFVVFASKMPGTFNLGGDLALFRRLIEEGDREGLEAYAIACIDALHRVHTGYQLPITTISLIQGTALGGGMEGALSANVVVAERGVQMGLPEVMFNLFPGMGAYSFLSRRLGAAEAEKVILSGKIWQSEDLHDLGLVDVLAEPGEGEQAVRDLIRERQARPNASLAMQQVRRLASQVPYAELEDIAMIWVDAALRLTARDLKIIDRLVRSQNKATERTPLITVN